MEFFWKRRTGRENTEEEEIVELNETEDEADTGPTLMALGFPSDRLYLVSSTDHFYVFTYLGSPLRQKENDFPERLPEDADYAKRKKKDIWVEKSQVQDFKLRMKHCVSTNLPNNAIIKLKMRDGNRHSMIMLDLSEREEYIDFFRDIANRRDSVENAGDREKEAKRRKKEDKRLALEKKTDKLDQEMGRMQSPCGKRWSKAVAIGLFMADVALSVMPAIVQIPFVFSALIGITLTLIPLLLIWMLPQYFSLRDSKKMEHRYSLLSHSLIPNLIFLTRVLSSPVHYDNVLRLVLIAFIVGAVVDTCLWPLFRRQLLPKGELISTLIGFALIEGAALSLSWNLILSTKEPNRVVSTKVQELHTGEYKKKTQYYVTLEIQDDEQVYQISEELYGTLRVGEAVDVGCWDGGLWIPYSCVLESE